MDVVYPGHMQKKKDILTQSLPGVTIDMNTPCSNSVESVFVMIEYD